MSKEEDIIEEFINSDNFAIINDYITKSYEDTIIEQDKEIKRLNNIINELEKDIDLELYKTRANDEYNKGLFNAFRYVKDKLQELKGSDKE